MAMLQQHGYSSRLDARKAFFRRAEALYHVSCKQDAVTLVQSLLLLTYWYDGPGEARDARYWLAQAITAVKAVKMNRVVDGEALTPTPALWKRLWWTCYTRDRMIALGTRRPVLIQDGEFTVPYLQFDDFETRSLPLRATGLGRNTGAAMSQPLRITLAKLYMELTHLCEYITQALELQYTTTRGTGVGKRTPTVRLVPKGSAADEVEVLNLHNTLKEWWSQLGPDLRYCSSARRMKSLSPSEVEEASPLLVLYQAMLANLFYAVSSTHRPQSEPGPSTTIAPSSLQALSRMKVRANANEVTNIYCDLSRLDLLRFLPNISVTCLIPATLVHMMDMSSFDENTRALSQQKARFCMSLLRRLRDVCPAANFAMSYLSVAQLRTEAVKADSDTRVGTMTTPGTLEANRPTAQLAPTWRRNISIPDTTSQNMGSLLSPLTLAPNEDRLLHELYWLRYPESPTTTIPKEDYMVPRGIRSRRSAYESPVESTDLPPPAPKMSREELGELPDFEAWLDDSACTSPLTDHHRGLFSAPGAEEDENTTIVNQCEVYNLFQEFSRDEQTDMEYSDFGYTGYSVMA